MSLKKDIILISTADWDNPFWTNKQHMALLFAQHGFRVLYVDSLGLRKPTLKSSDASRIIHRLKKSFPYPRSVQPNIWRVSPLVLPWHGNAHVRKFNNILLYWTLRWHMHVLDMSTPIIWTYNPIIANVISTLPHSNIVYHCVDDLSAAPHIDSKAVIEGEKQLGPLVNVCFATSQMLSQRMSEICRTVIYEPNVCDYNLFTSAKQASTQSVPQLAGIPHPRLLFVGALSQYKVDFDLMEAVTRQLPHVHWILVGQTGEGEPNTRMPPVLPNIHNLGPWPYEKLPQLMAHVDAAVLPAPHNTYTASMFPMKFFEYLAAGLPVISTQLPALAEFESLYFPADGPDAFAEAVTRVLVGERRDAVSIDQACKYHSWDLRFKRMEKYLGTKAMHDTKKIAEACTRS